MKKIISIRLIIAAISVLGFSCKKGPGPGGKAAITGKIYCKNYSSVYPYTLSGEYYIPGETVYINYGDESGVGKTVKTSDNGTYVFDFLRTGKYKVYALSRDITGLVNSQTVPIIKEVEISGKKDVVQMDDIVILK